ncbi:MAG: metal ABC transporter substrate-binding protein [Clostridia bacterium]|nr:metal ABC transporter substrate-binding protein [Clostridia bacterium]
MKKIFKGKKIFLVLTLMMFSLMLTGCENINTKSDKIEIVATNFPCYDFARAITKDNENVNITMLLDPGVESHNFDPTPQDIMLIENCDMFIYVGGESDAWADKILESLSSDIKEVKLCDYVSLVVEEFKQGMEEEHEEELDDEEVEYDEHVWTSPSNVIDIINGLKDEIILLDEDNKNLYEQNALNYINDIKSLRHEFKSVVDNASKKEIIFGDRFPLIYFVKEFGLDYYAAFPGCSSESEASAKTILFLKDKILEDEIKYVFHIELSAEKVCETLKDETGCEVLLFHTAHNVSKEEFESGETYYSLMHGNIERLQLALN